MGFPPTFRQQTVLKYLRPDSIYLAERCCPPSLPPCWPASFICRSRCCVRTVRGGAPCTQLHSTVSMVMYETDTCTDPVSCCTSSPSFTLTHPHHRLCLSGSVSPKTFFGGHPPVMSHRVVGYLPTAATTLPNQVFVHPCSCNSTLPDCWRQFHLGLQWNYTGNNIVSSLYLLFEIQVSQVTHTLLTLHTLPYYLGISVSRH